VLAKLHDFTYKVICKPGKDNVVADALFRRDEEEGKLSAMTMHN